MIHVSGVAVRQRVEVGVCNTEHLCLREHVAKVYSLSLTDDGKLQATVKHNGSKGMRAMAVSTMPCQ